jgi:hypothetical protein
MAAGITYGGKKVKRGKRMTKGKGWRLAKVKGGKRIFVGTLLGTHNLGARRIAIFSVPKKFD